MTVPVKKEKKGITGHIASISSSRSDCQIAIPRVNDLLVISYLVLERGVWSLPSPLIKHNWNSLYLPSLSFWPVSDSVSHCLFTFFFPLVTKRAYNVNSCALALHSILFICFYQR